MPKYYVGCEGSKEEFYTFILDLAQKIEWAIHPWEHPTVEKALYENKISKNIIPKQDDQEEITSEKPPEVSLAELRSKAVIFGRDHGTDAMKTILAKIGVTKLSDMTAQQRAQASQLIDEASQEA